MSEASGSERWHHRDGTTHGKIDAMITTMDASGRLVIPRDVRREAALEPGAPLEVRVRDGVVEIEPQPAKVSLQRRGGLVIATPAGRVPPLRAATVERVRRELASRRHRR